VGRSLVYLAAAQRHRPGLQFMVSTGRHHGFESLEEARVLLALDFAGDVTDVVSQPLKLRFGTSAEHTAAGRTGVDSRVTGGPMVVPWTTS
jgi:hypothetical protein